MAVLPRCVAGSRTQHGQPGALSERVRSTDVPPGQRSAVGSTGTTICGFHSPCPCNAPNAQYAPGPLLRPVPRSAAPLTLLRRVAAPHLQDLTRRVRESTNLVVVVGTEARFVRTVECGHALRVGNRVGQTVPADRSSGGKALLAQMPREQIDAHCSADHETELAGLHRQLAQVRNRGFAINDQGTEQGVTAVGVAVPDRTDVPHAALSISMPSVRFRRDQLAEWATELTATAAVIGRDPEVYA